MTLMSQKFTRWLALIERAAPPKSGRAHELPTKSGRTQSGLEPRYLRFKLAQAREDSPLAREVSPLKVAEQKAQGAKQHWVNGSKPLTKSSRKRGWAQMPCQASLAVQLLRKNL